MIHDYQLLREIYQETEKDLVEITSHYKILELLESSDKNGKGYKTGYTGFVFLTSDEFSIKFCTMENYWKSTKEIISEFDFWCLDEKYEGRVQIKAKTREKALSEFFEICGGYCKNFSCIENSFIFSPPKRFSNHDAIVTSSNQNDTYHFPYQENLNARDVNYPCSKFQYPGREFNIIRFYLKNSDEEDYIDYTIKDLMKEFKNSNYRPGNNNFNRKFKQFIRSKKLIPSIEISRNHYLLFEKEYVKDKE